MSISFDIGVSLTKRAAESVKEITKKPAPSSIVADRKMPKSRLRQATTGMPVTTAPTTTGMNPMQLKHRLDYQQQKGEDMQRDIEARKGRGLPKFWSHLKLMLKE